MIFKSSIILNISPAGFRLSGNCKTKVGIQFRPNKNDVDPACQGDNTTNIIHSQQRRENDPHLASFGHIFGGLLEVIFLLFPILKGPFRAEASQSCGVGMGNRSPSSMMPQTAHDLRFHAKRCTSLPQPGVHVREKFETSNKKGTYSFFHYTLENSHAT